MRLFFALAAAAVIGGCAPEVRFTDRPVNGFPAIRFERATRLRGVLAGYFEAPGGLVMIGDRTRPDGTQLYCGTLLATDLVARREAFYNCVSVTGDQVTTNADFDVNHTGHTTQVAPGTIAFIRSN